MCLKHVKPAKKREKNEKTNEDCFAQLPEWQQVPDHYKE